MWPYILGGIVILIGMPVAALLTRTRNLRRVRAAIKAVKVDDVAKLASEGLDVFQSHLHIPLNLDDLESSARSLDDAVVNWLRVYQAFSKPGVVFYYMLPIGALVGELMRRHGNGQWCDEPDGAPSMRIKWGVVEGATYTTYPFDKILKCALGVKKGDLYAYIQFGCGKQPISEETASRLTQ